MENSKVLTGKILRVLLESGTNAIINDKNRIDSLNVFPVPDGDTGSNMSATAEYAIGELKKNNVEDLSEVTAVFARGMLLGARGNSGVILSQIFKGFSVAFKDRKQASGFVIAKAFDLAKEYAYKSVMKPIEGTILTVIREISEHLNKVVTPSDTLLIVFSKATEAARKSVDNTPNLLAVLKEVGVVDSGGEGLYQIINGMKLALEEKFVQQKIQKTVENNFLLSGEIYDGEFGYCTETIVELKHKHSFHKDKFVTQALKLGNSAVVVQDEEILKIHIHTQFPGQVLNFAQKYGVFLKVKIDNMTQQALENKKMIINKSNLIKNQEGKIKIGVISINSGQGIINDVKELGASFIIEGGQTMNPSAQDFIKAIHEINSDNIIILPNNSNVILAAQQAVRTVLNKSIVIIPTKTQMQGIVAMINFNKDGELNEVVEEMTDAMKDVETGQVTIASRTTKINGIKVIKDEYLAIANRKIIGSKQSKTEASKKVLRKIINDDAELITIYYGSDATRVDATELSSYIENNFDVEVEIKNGDQPVYPFLISVE